MKRADNLYFANSGRIFPDSKLSILVIILLLTAAISAGCQRQTSSSDEREDQISEGARKIIETFMNCPNSDYYNDDTVIAIGLGVDEEKTKADLKKAHAEEKKLIENWDKAVGQYFSPNCLESFVSANARYYFDHYAGKTVEVQNIELIEKTKDYECVMVTILVDGKGQEEQLRFRKNSDGTIWQVGIWQEEYSDYI